MKIEGKKALVTGGSKGIGFAIAESLASRGASVVLSSRGEPDLKAAVKKVNSRHQGSALGYACDVGVATEVQDLIGFCADQLGGLDILVNNAGIGVFKSVADMQVSEWDRLMATNLNAVFYCTHFALPMLKASGESFVVNISSLAGKNAFPKGAAYNSSKFALTGFSEALMQEVRHDGIRVAYIMPGSVETWFRGNRPDGSASWKLAAQDVADVVIDTLTRDPRCLTSRIEMRPSRPPRK